MGCHITNKTFPRLGCVTFHSKRQKILLRDYYKYFWKGFFGRVFPRLGKALLGILTVQPKDRNCSTVRLDLKHKLGNVMFVRQTLNQFGRKGKPIVMKKLPTLHPPQNLILMHSIETDKGPSKKTFSPRRYHS